MKLEIVSPVTFKTGFSAAPSHTACAHFARLPFVAGYAARLAEVLCSDHPLAQLEDTALEKVLA